MGVADFAIGLGLLVVLLATGWTGTLRDLAERGAGQNYSFAVFLYVLMLVLISKVIGTPLEYYGFRLEHRYNLSNQRFRSWLWDEFKSLLVGLVMATIVVELLYMLIRQSPEHWWLIAWVVFLGLVVLLAQLAPVVLFPIFYKFEPLDNEELKRRGAIKPLIGLGCSPVLVSGTKKLFLKWIRNALRQKRIEVPECNGPVGWSLDHSFFRAGQVDQEDGTRQAISEETATIRAEEAPLCESP